MNEETPVATEEVVEAPSPTIILGQAREQAAVLAESGATYDIRYAGKRAAEMLGRLIKHIEHHRRIVGKQVA